ncbi:hypothetical protein QE152_g9808 [Popillia japonica]|uniref:Retrotransposon gag domain-containing protein n=1 Tax=Popillia japonica TaxID=7064 RepID=A0AAW1LTD5_POPJA
MENIGTAAFRDHLTNRFWSIKNSPPLAAAFRDLSHMENIELKLHHDQTQTQAKILEVSAKLGEVKGQLSKTEERIDQVEQVTAQQQERMHIEVQYIRKQYEKVGEEIKEELKKNPSQGSTIIHAEGCHTPALFRKPELWPKFKGYQDKLNPMTYIKNVVRLTAGIRDPSEALNLIRISLQERALEWFESVSDQVHNVDDFCEAFKRQYWDKNQQNRVKVQLLTGKYREGPLKREVYACDLYNKSKNIEGLSEKEIVQHILSHFILQRLQNQGNFHSQQNRRNSPPRQNQQNRFNYNHDRNENNYTYRNNFNNHNGNQRPNDSSNHHNNTYRNNFNNHNGNQRPNDSSNHHNNRHNDQHESHQRSHHSPPRNSCPTRGRGVNHYMSQQTRRSPQRRGEERTRRQSLYESADPEEPSTTRRRTDQSISKPGVNHYMSQQTRRSPQRRGEERTRASRSPSPEFEKKNAHCRRPGGALNDEEKNGPEHLEAPVRNLRKKTPIADLNLQGAARQFEPAGRCEAVITNDTNSILISSFKPLISYKNFCNSISKFYRHPAEFISIEGDSEDEDDNNRFPCISIKVEEFALKCLIDTAAEISLIRSSSLTEEIITSSSLTEEIITRRGIRINKMDLVATNQKKIGSIQ